MMLVLSNFKACMCSLTLAAVLLRCPESENAPLLPYCYLCSMQEHFLLDAGQLSRPCALKTIMGCNSLCPQRLQASVHVNLPGANVTVNLIDVGNL